MSFISRKKKTHIVLYESVYMVEEIKITISGTGFVGLITAAVFADRGFSTTALDVDSNKVDTVNKGETFFFEPHLPDLIKRVVEKKTLKASIDRVKAIQESDVTLICVGTPSNADGSCDLKFVESAARDIGQALAKKEGYHLVVAKSTIVPETTRKIIKTIVEKESKKKAGVDFGLCMNPEFLREGQSVHDTIFPDKIVIGEFDEKSGEILEGIFKRLYREEDDDFSKNWEMIFNKKVTCPKILRKSIETAECIKYANNSFLATKISFINEFANICERVPGVDINHIAEAIGLDFRISSKFLSAGAGFGGSCFPKDVNAMITFAKGHNYQPKLLESVMIVNAQQAKRMVQLTEEKVGHLKDKKIAILGLSFKPETDDMRSAPSIVIIEELLTKGAEVIAWDPQAIEESKKIIGNKIIYANSLEEVFENTDACLLVTEWKQFKKLEPKDFKKMKNPVLIDGRRIFDSKKFRDEGIIYAGIGLGKELD